MFVFIDLSHMITGQPDMGVRRGGRRGGGLLLQHTSRDLQFLCILNPEGGRKKRRGGFLIVFFKETNAKRKRRGKKKQ